MPPKSSCVKCGADLPDPGEKGGRPARYCGETCRRAAEFEIRRIQTELQRLLRLLNDARIEGADPLFGELPQQKARVAILQKLIDEGEQRLTLLVTG